LKTTSRGLKNKLAGIGRPAKGGKSEGV